MTKSMHPVKRNGWIVTLLILNMILWSIMCVGLLFTFAASMNPLALMFSGAFGVGAWWQKHLALDLNAHSVEDEPPRQFRRHRRHSSDNG